MAADLLVHQTLTFFENHWLNLLYRTRHPSQPPFLSTLSMSNPETPLSARRGKKANAIVLANAPPSESGRRPYLLKMLQHHIGTYILADTLDWDGEFAFPFGRPLVLPAVKAISEINCFLHSRYFFHRHKR